MDELPLESDGCAAQVTYIPHKFGSSKYGDPPKKDDFPHWFPLKPNPNKGRGSHAQGLFPALALHAGAEPRVEGHL